MVQGSGLTSRSATAQTPPVNQSSQYPVINIFFKYWEQGILLKKWLVVFVHSILSLNKERNIIQSAKTNNITLSYWGSLFFVFFFHFLFSFFSFLGESISVSQEFKLL